MTWITYLLSISDNISSCFLVTGILCLLAGVVYFIITMITEYEQKEADRRKSFRRSVTEDKEMEQEEAEIKEVRKKETKYRDTIIMRVIITGFIFITISVLIPKRMAIREAYFMTEGVKIIHAENAEKSVKEFSKKLDKLIEIFENK